MFRAKFKTDSEVRLKELEDKKEDCLLQKKMLDQRLQFEREEKEKDRTHQKEKEEREAVERKADREMMLKVLLEAIKK